MKTFNNRHNKSYFIEDTNWFNKFVIWFKKLFKIKSKGKIVWESRSVGVNAFIFTYFNNNVYVLIGERGNGAPDYKGYKNIISGYMDWDETGPEALVREVWEEAGFDLTKIKNIIVNFLDHPWHVNTDPSENKQNIALRYGVYFISDKLPYLTDENFEPNEVSKLEWVKLDNINNNGYKWAFEHDKKIKEFESLLIKNGRIIY